MSSETFDAVVIGGGPAGYVCAIRLAQNGMKAALVEKAAVGGTCLNIGCIPSKALISAGNLVDRIRHAGDMGIKVDGVRVDMGKLVSWKESVVQKLTGGVAGLLKNHKVAVYAGTARIAGPNAVEVKNEAGTQKIAAKHIVVATGSIPIEIPGFAFGEDVWSSTEALAPKVRPRRLVVIGGGYIGLELGIMYSKLGSEVTVVEATPGLLPGQDTELSKVVEKRLKKRGVAMHFEHFAKGYTKQGEDLHVAIESKGGEKQTIVCDKILSTVGRKPYADGLGLKEAGVAIDAKGFVVVDPQRRTNVPSIFAIGDIAGQPMLAHKGSKEGLVVADVIAGKKTVYDVKCIPAVIFTDPEIASVGLTEEQAKAEGYEPVVGKFPFAASGRALSLNEPDGFTKVVADKKTDLVLGVHMVGPEVTELIAEAALAIEMGATTEDLALTVHAHPTLPETLMEAAEAVHQKAVHIFQKPR